MVNNSTKTVMVSNSTNINKTNIHLSHQLIKQTKPRHTYHDGNPSTDVGQAQKCGRVKPVNGIPNLPHDSWIFSSNTDINKNPKTT
jgi:hypothetical protein